MSLFAAFCLYAATLVTSPKTSCSPTNLVVNADKHVTTNVVDAVKKAAFRERIAKHRDAAKARRLQAVRQKSDREKTMERVLKYVDQKLLRELQHGKSVAPVLGKRIRHNLKRK